MGTWTATPRTWVAGEVPTAANFNTDVRDFGRAFADAWTSYTPTLTASTTSPTNWTQTGYYMRAGKLVIARFRLEAGASMTKGSGTYRVALPVNANVSTPQYTGALLLVDASPATRGVYMAEITVASYLTIFGSAGTVTDTNPWTWAANDLITGTITYEAA